MENALALGLVTAAAVLAILLVCMSDQDKDRDVKPHPGKCEKCGYQCESVRYAEDMGMCVCDPCWSKFKPKGKGR